VAELDVVTPAAVRGLFRRQVVPTGSTLVLVSDLAPAKVLDQVAQALGEWGSDRSAIELSGPPPIVGGPLGAFDNPGAVQSQVRLSAPAVGREHDGYPAQQLANLIYGGYFSSRLVENIREDKGYTYGASSSTQFWPGRAGITVSFDTNTESTAAAIWEAYYELGRLALVPPSATEVDSARNYALGTLAASLATQAGYASMISNLAAYGLDATWLADYRKRVAAVTVDEVHAISRSIFAPTAFMGIVLGDLTTVGSALSAVLPVELP
jgi:predicted Zn-dependent peptidase